MPLKPRGLIDETDIRVSQFGHPAPAWMVNYADLMTELVCFFLILYAMSAALSKPLQTAKKTVEDTMKLSDVAGEVRMTRDGLVISLQEQGENIFFESGSAELTEQMKKILDNFSGTFLGLGEKSHDIIVEGHTDNIPIHTPKFSSNWELSTSRATNVVQYLLQKHHFPPERIAAIGYGENKSLAREPDEDLAAWRSKNRRVVFVIKNPSPNLNEKDSTTSNTN